jgi:hypothetical protein
MMDKSPNPSLAAGKGPAAPGPGPVTGVDPTREDSAGALARADDEMGRARPEISRLIVEALTSQFLVGAPSPSRPSAASRRPAARLQDRPFLADGIAAIRRRWPNLRNECDDDPIFVLSAGWRSGSTLLQRLIVHRCFLWGEPFGLSGPIESLSDPLRCFTDRWPESHHFYDGLDSESLSKKFIGNLYPSVQDLLRAHQAFFERVFAEPARRAGAARWGFKEVRLSVDHAIYLKWLFPRAKFLFLIRNPYDAWRSYAARAAKGWRWFKRWPDEPLTVKSFAAHWRQLVTSFRDDHRQVDGLMVRYEDLERGEYTAIEDYLGFALSREAGLINPSDGGPPPLSELSEPDRTALEGGLGTLATALGYEHRAEHERTTWVWLRVEPAPAQDHQAIARSEPAVAPQTSEAAAVGPVASGPSDPARCVILVPVGHHIEPGCDDALRGLERRGYTVRRVYGYAAIDQGRNQIATNALRDGFEELMWIDSDLVFNPDVVDRLRSHGLPITSGVCAKRGQRSFACNFPSGTKQVVFGAMGGLLEVSYAGAGFLHTRREVYESVRERFHLPSCNERFGSPMIPYFQPLVIPDGAGHWYLAEDYSFCYRAKECGYRIMADTTFRLMHVGAYAYSWEDAGSDRPRHGDYTFHIRE